MRRPLSLALVVLLMTAATVVAQEAGSRAWQRRLEITIPPRLPMVGIDAVDPFAASVDTLPVLGPTVAPEKVPVSGHVVVAAYVDPEGRCLGAVPLELPYPALTNSLLDELSSTRFEPARSGQREVGTWVVLDIKLDGKVKDAEILGQHLALPDPDVPPVPMEPARVLPSARLAGLPATPEEELSSPATPRNLRIRVPGREGEVPMRVLVEIGADGRCSRYVPLEVDSGLVPWLAATLTQWRAEPATRAGEPVSCWVVYTARARLKLSSLESSTVQVLRGRSYEPGR